MKTIRYGGMVLWDVELDKRTGCLEIYIYIIIYIIVDNIPYGFKQDMCWRLDHACRVHCGVFDSCFFNSTFLTCKLVFATLGDDFYPTCSMYGIFTYMYHKFRPNVASINGASGMFFFKSSIANGIGWIPKNPDPSLEYDWWSKSHPQNRIEDIMPVLGHTWILRE